MVFVELVETELKLDEYGDQHKNRQPQRQPENIDK